MGRPLLGQNDSILLIPKQRKRRVWIFGGEAGLGFYPCQFLGNNAVFIEVIQDKTIENEEKRLPPLFPYNKSLVVAPTNACIIMHNSRVALNVSRRCPIVFLRGVTDNLSQARDRANLQAQLLYISLHHYEEYTNIKHSERHCSIYIEKRHH